jgi:hypothetical protein
MNYYIIFHTIWYIALLRYSFICGMVLFTCLNMLLGSLSTLLKC